MRETESGRSLVVIIAIRSGNGGYVFHQNLLPSYRLRNEHFTVHNFIYYYSVRCLCVDVDEWHGCTWTAMRCTT